MSVWVLQYEDESKIYWPSKSCLLDIHWTDLPNMWFVDSSMSWFFLIFSWLVWYLIWFDIFSWFAMFVWFDGSAMGCGSKLWNTGNLPKSTATTLTTFRISFEPPFFLWFWMWGKYSKTSESESTTGLRLGSRPVFACTESQYFLKSLILYWCVSTDGININCHYQWLYGISHPPPE